MSSQPRRLLFYAAAFAVLLPACASAKGFELSRVQRKDVQVLPGADGFTHPLTGIVTYSPQEWQNRSILAVKVGNALPERPQSGLDRADVIYEEIVEGGVTRFMALFSTNQSPRVGPVRSVRTVDHKIVQPLSALFAYSGGVPPVVGELRSTPGVTDVGADRATTAYRRDGNRSSPYNLYTSTDQLWNGHNGSAPRPQFEFLSSADDAATGGTEDAKEVKVDFSDRAQVSYTYDSKTGRYQRFMFGNPHLVEGNGNGIQLAFRNVLVQSVNTSRGSVVDRAGVNSTDIHMIGDGGAVLFRGGKAVRGRWQRGSVSEPTRFVSDSGEPLRLAPGETIIELLPNDRDVFVR